MKGGIILSVGANIKKRRFELKMSQQELAEAMGYKTRSTIAKIESGENDVTQKKLQRFAVVLDTTVEALVAGSTNGEEDIPTLTQVDSDTNHRNAVIILAGGKSGRNNQNIPNQFINIHDKPMLVYCLEAYQAHPAIDDLYVVCLKGWEDIVRAYARQYRITKLRGLIPGGISGIASLKNGIDCIKKRYTPDDTIIIQEATRPHVNTETISKLLQACAEKGSATVCHIMNDYVQFNLSDNKAQYIDRNTVVALQSPEAHKLSLLLEVFEKAKTQRHPLAESCCAMLMYNLGYEINFIEGGFNNIKIVREEDLTVFSALVKK